MLKNTTAGGNHGETYAEQHSKSDAPARVGLLLSGNLEDGVEGR
jgi:hypothetical protein